VQMQRAQFCIRIRSSAVLSDGTETSTKRRNNSMTSLHMPHALSLVHKTLQYTQESSRISISAERRWSNAEFK